MTEMTAITEAPVTPQAIITVRCFELEPRYSILGGVRAGIANEAKCDGDGDDLGRILAVGDVIRWFPVGDSDGEENGDSEIDDFGGNDIDEIGRAHV